MDRRLLLKLMGAAAATSMIAPIANAAGMRVVVAGAGIVGASIAYHLAKAGASVTVIDSEGPASHASRGTFAWINATWAKQPRAYHALNQEGVSNWQILSQELNIPLRQTGSLEWFDGNTRQQKLTAQIDEQIAWGEPARMIDAAEVAKLEPGLVFDSTKAAYSGNDAAVDPVAATHAMLNAAKAMGANLIFPSKLTAASYLAGELKEVTTSQGAIRTDKLVLATGAAPYMMGQFTGTDLPQRSTPGVIAITKPMARIINRIIAAPGVHMHQREDGRVVLGEQDGAPQNQAHAMRLASRPNAFPTRAFGEEHAARMLAVAEQFVPAIATAEIENVYIGWRPLPIDGHPVIGVAPKQPDVYTAVMHSGVSLAPIVGQLVAHELLTGETIERLGPYRPDRDFTEVKRY
ncbi:NAD(P)/FAD-dependent oxidoreductase [Kordiimonas aquimaris]|uniref:NAD(P)/FAD-dependent oxidoreductase n=1 Tax=Kordiimonas aquimaris TaxID=707591 RepID=UPI0021CE438C|nr:FAD-binding oxidoreductase [Kordiimonas aquimaris]